MASANNNKMSREDFRRAQELEEARKAGLAPAELDEEGNEINPHIPQYMSNAPWYLNSTQPSLKHQKDWRVKTKDGMDKWYKRGKDTKGFQASKFRKGACTNCGAMGHKAKDCLERPRTVGAKHTNKHIVADDVTQNVNLSDFDAKRDRWNGYDAADYQRVHDMYDTREKLRQEVVKKTEMEELYAKAAKAPPKFDGTPSAPAEADEDKIQDEEDANFAKVEKRVRTTAGGSTGTVRDLRIREDTAKYLLNLDTNSAYYDPKSRSMREDPQPHKPSSDKTYHGDAFTKFDGDYAAWQAMTLHSMDAASQGQDIHMQAAPSQAEALKKRFAERKAKLEMSKKKNVLEKYGNAAPDKPDEALVLAATERYVEYDRAGRVIRGAERVVKSKYDEDVFPGNHTSVWGSWWKDGVWGYACCHGTVKNGYCTKGKGKEVAAKAAEATMANLEAHAANESARQKAREGSKLKNVNPLDISQWGEAGDVGKLDKSKLEEALEEEEARDAEEVEDERKRKYNLAGGGEDDAEVTAEQMEAYRMKKARHFDPMKDGEGTKGYDMV